MKLRRHPEASESNHGNPMTPDGDFLGKAGTGKHTFVFVVLLNVVVSLSYIIVGSPLVSHWSLAYAE